MMKGTRLLNGFILQTNVLVGRWILLDVVEQLILMR